MKTLVATHSASSKLSAATRQTTRRTRGLWLLAAAVAGMSAFSSGAQAATVTWNASPSDGDWVTNLNSETDTNWSTGISTYPGSTTALNNGDIATFLSSGTTSILVNSATLNIGSITFGATATAISAFTIGSTGGNALLLSNGGTILYAADATPTNTVETINAPLVFEGTSYTFNNANTTASNVLNFGGSITTASATGTNLNLNGAAASGYNVISGVISNGFTTAATSLVMPYGGQAGKWILSAANTFTGNTDFNFSNLVIQLNNSYALQNSSVILNTGNANSLKFNAGLGNAYVAQFSGNASESLQDTGGAAVTLNIGSWLNISNNQYGSFGGSLTGSGSVVKFGATTTWFSGNNTYTGTTTVSAGTLNSEAGGGASITTPFGTGAFTTGSGANIGLYPQSAGATAWTIASGVTSGSAFTYGPGTTVALTKNGTSLTVTVGGGGTAALTQSTGGTLIIKTGNADLGSGENLIFNGTAPTLVSTQNIVSPSIVGAGGSAVGIIDFLTYNSSTGFGVAAYSAQTATFTGTNGNVYSMVPTATGQTVTGSAYSLMVNSGTNNAYPVAISGTLNLGKNADGSSAPQAALIINVGGASGGYRSDTILSGGTINFGTSQGIIYGNIGSGTDTVNTSTAFAGSGGLTVAGTGTVGISGTNTFSGGLTVAGTTMNGGADTTLGDASNSITLQGGTLYLGGTALSTGRALAIYGYSGLTAGVYGGNITGGGYIASKPVLILTGNNNLAGIDITNGGPVKVASDANLGGGQLVD